MDVTEQQLWQRIVEDSCQLARQKIFSLYQNWAAAIAAQWTGKLFIPGAEYEDFVQYANLGLLEAIDGFNPSLGFEFATYARHRIKGSILNSIFRFSEKTANLKRTEQETNQLVSDLLSAQQETNQSPLLALSELILDLSIDYALQNPAIEPDPLMLMGTAYTSPEYNAFADKVSGRVRQLDEPMATILKLYYQQGLNFQQIAEILDLTKGRISQLHKAALSQLRCEHRS